MFRAVSNRAIDLGVTRQLIEDERFNGDTVTIRGRQLVNFGLCSYLGLGTDARLVDASIQATKRFGTSYSSSIAYTALGLYGELTERLEAMMGARVVVGGTTTLAHLAALPVMVGPGDLVLVDGQAHASLLSVTPTLTANGATVQMVPHNDLDAVSSWVEGRGQGRQVWYLTDGIFSMHGDTVPAEGLHALLDHYENLHAYVDDAHGFSWRGEKGRGLYLYRAGWHDRLVISAGMAKSFGTMGGIVATRNAELVELINLTGSPLVFGGPIPPPILGASVASADIHLSSELPRLQDALVARIDHVNELAAEMGLPLSGWDTTPLWFLEVGSSSLMLEVLTMMRDAGFFLNGAVFPVVPRGRAGLRFTVTNDLSFGQIESMLGALNQIRLEKLGGTELVIDLTDAAMAKDPETAGPGSHS